MTLMTGSRNVYDTFRSLRASRGWTQWFRDNPDGGKIINHVLLLRESNG